MQNDGWGGLARELTTLDMRIGDGGVIDYLVSRYR